MNKLIFTTALLFFTTLSFSQGRAKHFPFNSIIGIWNSTAKLNNVHQSDFHYKDFNIEFISSKSFRFLLPESNPISHITYSYEIDSVQGFSIIKYYMPEVSNIDKMILFVMEDNTISLVMVDKKNINNPLKSLNDKNFHYVLKRK